ncbi:Atypical/RIO protein Kinase [Phytophthora cinnamomi]|uniref:Atypical/RIO protein Kinase n=1 Tax=Phytophthora cinnamomi TaxID=4785 RepID=UPI0035595EB6|nr:Atypical/RIO protein Kinase [Phytophthora cinnamomi]
MATTCPWKVTAPASASTQQPSSPTLQEIMDEELALRLQDEEWVQLAELDAGAALDLEDSEDDFEEKEPAPVSAVQDDRDDYDESYDLDDDAYSDEFGDGPGFKSLRESMRRQAKHEGHRGAFLAKAHIDLGRNGSGAHESMFDEQTQAVLRKLVRKELVTAVKTRVHSGREANVFHGVGLEKATGQERDLALKIFKTNKGDFTKGTECDPTGRRYGMEYVRKTIRRHLKAQSEHEYKYLSRASAALAVGTVTETESKLASAGRGARVPKPFILREHVLVTEFVGANGHLAPSLGDAKLNGEQLRSAYTDLLRAVRRLYQRARLVHGNLTEASILYYKDQCWIMNLGQAVEVGSENHATMLTRDLDNLDAFFRSCGLIAATKRQVGLLSVDVAREYVMAESPEQMLRRFPVLEPLLRE